MRATVTMELEVVLPDNFLKDHTLEDVDTLVPVDQMYLIVRDTLYVIPDARIIRHTTTNTELD